MYRGGSAFTYTRTPESGYEIAGIAMAASSATGNVKAVRGRIQPEAPPANVDTSA